MSFPLEKKHIFGDRVGRFCFACEDRDHLMCTSVRFDVILTIY